MKMEDMALLLMIVFFAGGLFSCLMIMLFARLDSLLEKEAIEAEEKAAQEGGNCF